MRDQKLKEVKELREATELVSGVAETRGGKAGDVSWEDREGSVRLVQEQAPGHAGSWIPGESLEAGSIELGDWDTAKTAEGQRGSSVTAVWVTRGWDASSLEQESGRVPGR